MALNNFTTDLNNHQSQPDRPTLSASDLKILFDKAANDTQDFINDEMVANIYDKGEVDTAIANAEISPTSQKATQAEAEAGTSNDTWMTPLRTKQSIDANVPTPVVGSYEPTSSTVNVDTREYTMSVDFTNTDDGRVMARIDSDSDTKTETFNVLSLDGTDDYATLPASVGQLTNGSNAFELNIKFQMPNVANQGIIAKTDTTYSATANPKGWALRSVTNGTILSLRGRTTNNGTLGAINASGFIAGEVYWAKITFNGTTVEMLTSTDGINFTSQGTSTDANLIGGLSISDSVDTQIGREWQGSAGYFYIGGNIFFITLSKLATPTNEYLFENTGVNQSILDTVGSDDGSSFNGANQTTADVDSPLTGIPTLNINSQGAKDIVGELPLRENALVEFVYQQATDDYYALQKQDSNLVAETTLSGSSVTISGLDINADGNEYIISIGDVKTSASGNLQMEINSSTSGYGSAYTRIGIDTRGTSSNANIGVTDGASETSHHINLNNFSNNFPLAYARSWSKLSAQGYIYMWSAPLSANITSITFKLSTGTFTTGNVKIYKRS